MARLYETADENRRIAIAGLFYQWGQRSPDAERVLLRDAHTTNPTLRIGVQYALGRVSDDPKVIDTLLEILQHDASPVFRDKAACALAYDQVHLTEAQKVRLYEGLIDALSSPKGQVQAISIQALSILTGQDKGFRRFDPPEKKQKSIEVWRRWLAEYRANL
jgi:HEAT repeat protein